MTLNVVAGVTSVPPVVNLVIPVYNEATTIEQTVIATRDFLDRHFAYPTRITIADNASVDDTWIVAQRLSRDVPGVKAVHLAEKGRGRALHEVWSASDAQVFAYMDVDMSTDLSALLPLVAPLVSGHSHIAIGTRLARTSQVVRGPKREFISRTYNALLHTTLGAHYSDAQCGFKAIRADAAHELLPYVRDTQWFFDTELLTLADRAGLRIHEVPVDWIDDPDSRVNIPQTVAQDLRGIWRLETTLHRVPLDAIREHLPRAAEQHQLNMPTRSPNLMRQLLSFGVIGACSTIAYALLFLLFRIGMGAQAANFSALLVTAIANTAANRALTFGVHGRTRMATHHLQGLLVFAFGWMLTSSSLAILNSAAPHAPTFVEIVVLTAANLVATILRFVLLKAWVFSGPHNSQSTTASHSSPHTGTTTR